MFRPAAFGRSSHACENSAALPNILEQALLAGGSSRVMVPIDYRKSSQLTERLGHIPATLQENI